MSRYLLQLPSAGLVNGIDSVFVNDISVGKYLEILTLRNAYSNSIGKILVNEYVEDKSILKYLPAVDKEFIASNLYVECFSDVVNISLKCPNCDHNIKEEFNIANYEYYFLEDKDRRLFTQRMDGKTITLCLPVDIKLKYDIEDYIEKIEGGELSEYDRSELEYIIRGDIEMNCGTIKQYSIICNNCSSEILTNKPYGIGMLDVNPKDFINERKNIFSIFNIFSYAAHQPSGDLMNFTLKDVNIRLDEFLEFKQKESESMKE